MKILMVCLGNICRSPLAEGVLAAKAKKAGLNWVVDSAGTNGYHTGEAPHVNSIKVAALHGIDISKQRSRDFTGIDFEEFDMIYAMAQDVLTDIRYIAREKFDEKKVTLFLNELFPGKNKDLPDPWSKPEKAYHEVYDLVDKTCTEIIKKATIEI
jgi:protein-tyrosine phosphatase